MTKTIWTYIVVLSLMGATGVGTYFYVNQTASAPTTTTPNVAQQTQIIKQTAESDDEDIKKRTLEGIGTIKRLKPVTIQPAQR